MKRLFLLSIAVLFILLIPLVKPRILPDQTQGEKGTVTEIIDGDTYKIKIKNKEKTVRVLGIDFPDLTKEKLSKWYEEGLDYERIESCYEEGKEILEKELLGKELTLIYDPREARRDLYGRTIAYLLYGNISIGEFMVENGYAIMFDPNEPLCEECAMLKIKEKQKGCLWE